MFEDQKYTVEVPGTASMAEVKAEVLKVTNIVPREQMLVDSVTQMEPPEGATIAEIEEISGQQEVTLHLLTPNSSA